MKRHPPRASTPHPRYYYLISPPLTTRSLVIEGGTRGSVVLNWRQAAVDPRRTQLLPRGRVKRKLEIIFEKRVFKSGCRVHVTVFNVSTIVFFLL